MQPIDWVLILNTFIANLPLLITATAGLLVVLHQIGILHRSTNSKMDLLLEATARASRAEGHAQGVIDEQARVSDPLDQK